MRAQWAILPELKAADLLNFVKFIEWPADRPKPSPVVLCVVGDDDGHFERRALLQDHRSTEGRLVDSAAAREFDTANVYADPVRTREVTSTQLSAGIG